jgi:hypothetical protein
MSDRVDSAFLNNVNDTLETMVLASPLPFAGGCTIAVFSGADGELRPSRPDSGTIRASDAIAPALLAAHARAWADLASALYERTEADWAKFDKYLDRWWDRRGPYLVPKIRRSRYGEFFSACLDKGILVSPDYDVPSIIPYVADPGEFKPLGSGLLP